MTSHLIRNFSDPCESVLLTLCLAPSNSQFRHLCDPFIVNGHILGNLLVSPFTNYTAAWHSFCESKYAGFWRDNTTAVSQSTRQQHWEIRPGSDKGAARGAHRQGALWRHWNNRKHAARKLTLPHAKEFLRKPSATWTHAPPKTFASPLAEKV